MKISYHHFLTRFGATHCQSPDDFKQLRSERLTSQQKTQMKRWRKKIEMDSSPDQIKQFMDAMAADPFHPLLLSLNFDLVELAGVTIHHMLSAPDRILEVGGFTGYLSLWLAQEFPKSAVHAIDFATHAIRRGREFAKAFGVANISFQALDITQSAPAGTYDTVIAVRALDHLHSQTTALQHIRTALSSDGQLLVVTRYHSLPGLKNLVDKFARTGFSLQHLDWLYSVDLGHLAVHALLICDTQTTSPIIDFGRQHHTQLVSQLLLATVGCSVFLKDHDWRIGQIWPGSKADQADIQPGDRLHAVNNIQMDNITEKEVRHLFTGASTLRLELTRDGSPLLVKVDI